ncbi:MAG: oxygen-dependent coproporphyrinogen oxidase [Alphaproteobacteria bacterium]|nr:oxygen-dependent coproporphyrinogen oxidase [Alphaproteobacteria bacterium]MCB9792593.1 oxygen-dependent coproporphyrinogen oxidase [Alphaproteobacteria bacterium]
MRDRAQELFRDTQDRICAAVARVEGGPFQEDHWDRPGGGGGRSRVIQGGAVFEKAGVNWSAVHGELSDQAAAAMRAQHPAAEQERRFFATGISLVIHPHNPFAPTVHANYRYFELGDGSRPGSWWFGGGADLTPAYLFEEDARQFHRVHKAALDRHGAEHYPRFKRWCDDYFFLRHRGERRGVGGIFFDNLALETAEASVALVSDCAGAFLDAWLPIIERRRSAPYTSEHKRWQALRRGRYVEFNLVWDRGTHFGLRTDARVESVLMSLPLTARWEYDQHPEPGSPEARVLEVLREPVDWIPFDGD